jgi:hypothetical protein
MELSSRAPVDGGTESPLAAPRSRRRIANLLSRSHSRLFWASPAGRPCSQRIAFWAPLLLRGSFKRTPSHSRYWSRPRKSRPLLSLRGVALPLLPPRSRHRGSSLQHHPAAIERWRLNTQTLPSCRAHIHDVHVLHLVARSVSDLAATNHNASSLIMRSATASARRAGRKSRAIRDHWWAHQDSNLGPTDYESSSGHRQFSSKNGQNFDFKTR